MKYTLYKMNRHNLISWWTIERTEKGNHIKWGQNHLKMAEGSRNENFVPLNTQEEIIQDFESRIEHQEKRLGYTKEIPTSRKDRPMLAQQWKDHEKLTSRDSRAEFKSYAIQPKLDGMRCIGTNTKMVSRKDDLITSAPHISALLSHLPETIKLDGELYIPNCDLQTIMSFARRTNVHPDYSILEYHVFDLIDLEATFEERHNELQLMHQHLTLAWHFFQSEVQKLTPGMRALHEVQRDCPIKLVETHFTPNKDDITKYHKLNLERKYEGSIIRNPEGLYELDSRSPNLLKYKEYIDSEYEIVDVIEAHNKTGLFVCKTEDGKIFDVDPAWTTDAKRLLLIKKNYYIGRMLTVRYEKLSRDGIPIPAKGHETRAKKDVGL